MERLSKAAQENIRKMSTVRLQFNLLRVGEDEQAVAAMDRQQLLAAWAILVADGKDKPEEPVMAERVPAGYDPVVEREKLQWKREKFDKQMRLEEEKMKMETERSRMEAASRQKLEMERLDFERMKMDELLKKKEERIEIERATLKMQQQKEANEATRLKKYADALRGAIPKQTNDPIEVVAFFRNVERLWDDFKVPVELQGAIVKPFLTDRAKALVARLDPSKSSYKDIKEALLREYKISAPMYREKFNELVKNDDQTYVMYVSSLMSLIDGYVEARKITELADLRNVLVSDRLKAALKPAVLRYVLSVEAKSDKGWLEPYQLAELVDDYVANYHDPVLPKSGVLGISKKSEAGGQTSSPKTTFVMQGNRQTSHSFKENVGNKNPLPAMSQKSQLMCWHCGGPHLVRFCQKKQISQRTGGRPTPIPSTGRVSKAAIEPTGGNDAVGVLATPSKYESSPDDVDQGCDVDQPGQGRGRDTDQYCSTSVQGCVDIGNSVNRTAVDCVNTPVLSHDDCMIIDSVKHPLSYMDVVVTLPQTPDVCVRAKALKDSGSECALICHSVLQRVSPTNPVVPIGEVKISGICGDAVVCPLIRIKVHEHSTDDSGLIITAAVMSTLSDDLILPSTIVDCLNRLSVENELSAQNCNVDNAVESLSNDIMTDECKAKVVTRSGISTEVNNVKDGELLGDREFVDPDIPSRDQTMNVDRPDVEPPDQLINEQEFDISLKQC